MATEPLDAYVTIPSLCFAALGSYRNTVNNSFIPKSFPKSLQMRLRKCIFLCGYWLLALATYHTSGKGASLLDSQYNGLLTRGGLGVGGPKGGGRFILFMR